MREITHGNLFSGSGTWELAAQLFGIKTFWEAEIEPFPVALEAKRFPDAMQLGDVSKIKGAEIPVVDIMTNSSPCTNLSVAGKREGLEGSESSLFYHAVRICKEMRGADAERRLQSGWSNESVRLRPRFWCWENVPGALLSSGQGLPQGFDFKAVLESIVEIVQEKHSDIPIPPGGWHNAGILDGDDFQIAWRVIDAQGELPQRRKRIFLVADLGGHCADRVLFEREGIDWDFKEVAQTWEDTSRTLGERIDRASRIIRGEISGDAEGMEERFVDSQFPPLTYDARGNGDGTITSTIVGGIRTG